MASNFVFRGPVVSVFEIKNINPALNEYLIIDSKTDKPVAMFGSCEKALEYYDLANKNKASNNVEGNDKG